MNWTQLDLFDTIDKNDQEGKYEHTTTIRLSI
jgi:hypothetical protein